ncbi:MAG: DegT/DnrJ/EryC1/StrS family aminotransferase [Nanoarchaeota archaeon]|nr:DegT/DnrJ/EryC1/StrS family aminotransferase [Nanoarchaeota archaeon]
MKPSMSTQENEGPFLGRKMKVNLFHPLIPESAIGPVNEILRSKWIGQGSNIAEFEKRFSEKFKTYNPVAVITGTAAIHLSLVLAGIGPGDEVITTPLTCPATNHPILYQFARPVFADIQYETGNMDPEDVERKITPKTKAIMCVDYGGRPCDLDEIKEIALRHNLQVIEDSAQALGAEYKGTPIGRIADYTCFSFQALKIITTIEGGMLCVKDPEKYKEAIRRRWYGVDREAPKNPLFGNFDYDATEIGYKYNMNNVAATVGLEQLKSFDSLFSRKQEIAKRYNEELGGVSGITLFKQEKHKKNTYYLFPMHIRNRDKVAGKLMQKGIEVSVGHTRNDKLSVFGGKFLNLPNLTRFSESVICTPIHNKLTDEEVSYVIKSLKEAVK